MRLLKKKRRINVSFFVIFTLRRKKLVILSIRFSFEDADTITLIILYFLCWLENSFLMEYNPSVSMILPDSIGLIENDFDDDDIVREQTNRNEVN